MACLANRQHSQAGASGRRQRLQFRSDRFRQPATSDRGRRVSRAARPDPARRGKLRPAAMPEAYRRRRKSEPRRRGGARGISRPQMTVDSRPLFTKVALIGVGLIGSSMAHAMRRGGLAAHIAGYAHRPETLDKARALGFADTLHDTLQPTVKEADLVVLATPVGTFGALAKQMAPFLKRGAILSDVGSVKMAV